MMAKRRHTAEQIIARLREAEVLLDKGMKMPHVSRKLVALQRTDGRDSARERQSRLESGRIPDIMVIWYLVFGIWYLGNVG